MKTATSKNSPPASAAELKARALRLLAGREHTRAELARKLAPHAASPEALEQLLALLVEKRLLSEARFAEERARMLGRKYGALRVQQDLRARGVAEDLVERATAQTAGGELEQARAIVRRRFGTPATTPRERARRIRFLQSRGFAYDTIRAALGSLAEPDAAEDDLSH